MKKRLLALFLVMLILIGACGCMKKNDNNGKKETDAEYAEQMLMYMEEKYDTTFQVVESIFPKSGFNSGMNENILVVENPDGVTANVKARMGSPYSFYDDYVNACGADMIQKSLDLVKLQEIGSARIYAVVNSKSVSQISIDAADVSSVTLVVNIPRQPDEDALVQLYDAYSQICDAGYQKLYLIAWFTDGAAEFDQAVYNYRVYGKSNLEKDGATVYATLKITDINLSFDAFQSALVEQ